MTTELPITPRTVSDYVDDLFAVTPQEMAARFGVGLPYVADLIRGARLAPTPGQIPTAPLYSLPDRTPDGLPVKCLSDHLDGLARAGVKLDEEIKAKPRKLAPPRTVSPNPGAVEAIVVTQESPATTLAALEAAQIHDRLEAGCPDVPMTPLEYGIQNMKDDAERVCAMLGTLQAELGPQSVDLETQVVSPAKRRAPAYCKIIPRGRSTKYTAQDPERPTTITHYCGDPIMTRPQEAPQPAWAAPRPTDNADVGRVVQEALAALLVAWRAKSPEVDYHDAYYREQKVVSRARQRVKDGKLARGVVR